MKNQIEIKIVDGFWTINNKKVAECSHAKKDFFDKYIKLSLIKSPITEKSKSTFKNKGNEVKKSFNYRFKNTDKTIQDYINSHSKIDNLIFELKN
jgi:hypothetical protein